jgi:hypothetical protein
MSCDSPAASGKEALMLRKNFLTIIKCVLMSPCQVVRNLIDQRFASSARRIGAMLLSDTLYSASLSIIIYSFPSLFFRLQSLFLSLHHSQIQTSAGSIHQRKSRFIAAKSAQGIGKSPAWVFRWSRLNHPTRCDQPTLYRTRYCDGKRETERRQRSSTK